MHIVGGRQDPMLINYVAGAADSSVNRVGKSINNIVYSLGLIFQLPPSRGGLILARRNYIRRIR